MTEPEPLQQLDRTYVRFRGRKLSYFSGCDYFRLASHPKVIAGLLSGVKRYGFNVAASRLTTGNHVLYRKLENQLARFFKAADALLVSNGYLTNLVVAQALAGNFSHALIDAKAHTSLKDATRFLDCPVLQFKHRDAADLSLAVRRCGPQARLLLLTDGMFAHNGSAAPLAEYLDALPRDAWLLVDDAHGAGVLGKTGGGSVEYSGVGRKRLIQTITLSKAFGSFGGAIILGAAGLRPRILRHSPSLAGSTPPPLPIISAALQAVALLRRQRDFRLRLDQNANGFKAMLRAAALEIPEHPGPILAALPETDKAARQLHSTLLKAGIYPPLIYYPGGPLNGYFRFVISSEHSQEQLRNLAGALKSVSGWRAG